MLTLPTQNGFKYTMVVLGVFAFLWRLAIVDLLFGEASGCPQCVVEAITVSDAPFFFAWLLVLWAGCSTQRPVMGRALRFLAVVALVIYVVDIYVLRFFLTRPRIPWLFSYGATPGIVLEQIWSSGAIYLGLLILAAVLMLFSLLHTPNHSRQTPIATLSTFALAFGLSSATSASYRIDYVGAWAIENIFTIDHSFTGTTSRYSDAYLNSRSYGTLEPPDCREGSNLQRDLMVLIMESWSSYQSQQWGGENDWTPNLDRMARDSIWANRFIAGGFHTHHGLMSILTGIPVLSSMTSPYLEIPFEPAWGWAFSLPKQLGTAGYHVAFLTSGDLSLTNKKEWINHIGFHHVEGHDHPFYDGLLRSHFRSAPDAALFTRATDYWLENTANFSPLAIVVESVSMHTPFIHPVTKEKSEEAVVRYVDQAVGDFYKNLRVNGFFEKGGLLVVVSDHRAMKYLDAEEKELFGESAHALLPFLVIGNDLDKGPLDDIRHQSDVTPSLAAFLTPNGCGYPGWESLFDRAGTNNDRCVFNLSGASAREVHVFCDQGHGRIQLDGDQSRFNSVNQIEPERQEFLLRQLAIFRDRSQKNTDQYLKRE